MVNCSSDAECPEGTVCVDGGRCVEPDRVDSAGAALLVPPNNTVVTTREVPFVWASVPNASLYSLVVATDAAFTNVVARHTEAATTQTLSLSAGTYFWRVTTDITNASDAVSSSVFGVLDDVLYVSCPLDPCGAGEDEMGTIARPYRSITRGMRVAVNLEVAEVHVARRTNDAPFAESFNLLSGNVLRGGYDSAFTAQTGRTEIAMPGRVVTVIDTQGPTELDGFSLTNTLDEGDSTVLQMYQTSNDLVVRNTGVHAPFWRNNVVAIELTSDGFVGPRLIDCDIDGTHSENDEPALITVGASSGVQLENVRLHASAPSTYDIIGIRAFDQSSIAWRGGSLTIEGGQLVRGVLSQTARTLVHDVTMDLVASDVVAIRADAPNALDVQRSTIRVRNTKIATGILAAGTSLPSPNQFLIASNVIELSPSATTPKTRACGISLEVNDARVIGNTIAIGPASDLEAGVWIQRAYPSLINNLIVSVAHSCGQPVCNTGIVETALGTVEQPRTYYTGQPTALFSNALAGYPVSATSAPYLSSANQSSYSDDREYPGLSNQRIGERFSIRPSGNTSSAGLANVGLANLFGPDGVFATADDDARPTINLAGYNPEPEPCRPAARDQDTESLRILARFGMETCAPLYPDRDNKPRASTPTIGAYER